MREEGRVNCVGSLKFGHTSSMRRLAIRYGSGKDNMGVNKDSAFWRYGIGWLFTIQGAAHRNALLQLMSLLSRRQLPELLLWNARNKSL